MDILAEKLYVPMSRSFSGEKAPGVKVTSYEKAPTPPTVQEVEVVDGSTITKPMTVCELFETQARSHPNEPAVQFEQDEPISFGTLNGLANRIARLLSLRAELIVPVCMDLSVEMIACVLAILKSGAAYVILNPQGGVNRNNFIVEEIGADTVLVHKKYSQLFDKSLVVEETLAKLDLQIQLGAEACAELNLSATVDPDSVAYIIYTSGTSGNPKAVVITHRAATTGISCYSLRGMSRWLLFFNPVFSAAQRTILATLAKGGCLCLAGREKLATSLAEVLAKMKIDALGITPSALALLSPEMAPSTLKQIIIIGEPVSPTLMDTWVDKVELRNSFGLSECAQLNFGRRLERGGNPRIIGVPHDTTKAYVVFPGLTKLAPEGTTGELCLVGPQLAQGYLKRPEKTAEVFIDNPFGEGKLYRTGDIAIKHKNGLFEVLGRIDFQIKLNGQRLEPEEVNAAIAKHHSIKLSAVVAANISNQKSLVGVLVPKSDADWARLIEDLRLDLKQLLPPYMIPSYWIRRDALPTNVNGKVNVAKICAEAESLKPEELLGRSQRTHPYTKQITNKVELQIRNAWANILQMSAELISRDDSFTALGGSSIQAIRVVTELKGVGVVTELGDLLRSEDLASTAAASTFDESLADSDNEEVMPFSLIDKSAVTDNLKGDLGVADAYPPTPIQEGLIADTLQGNEAYLYQRSFDVEKLDLIKLKLAFSLAYNASNILRTVFVPTDAGIIQTVRNDMTMPWKELYMDHQAYIKSDRKAGVELGRVMFRVAVLNKRILVVSMHHSLFDFWSHRFVYEDVARLYKGLDLVPRAPFKGFVRRLLQKNAAGSETWWKRYLSDSQPTLLNHSPTGEEGCVSRCLEVDLEQGAASLKVTIGSIIYAAWALVLSHHTGSNDVIFATTLSGREVPLKGIDRMDGPTLTIVPQRIVLDPQGSLRELVGSTHRQLWDVVKHSQLGMRQALKVSDQSAQMFDTMVNILAKDDDADVLPSMFERHGAKPVWQSEFATLEAEKAEGGMTFRLVSDLEGIRAKFILDQLFIVITTIVDKPDISLGSIDIVSVEEHNWLSKMVGYKEPERKPLHGGFESVAVESPDLVAIQWQNVESLTYKQLDQAANRLAAHLLKIGVKSGSIVPLLLDKSVGMIIAILGVLKAGAAYLPMSPDNPTDRNVLIITEVEATLVLTESAHRGFSRYHDAAVLYLDSLDVSGYSNDPSQVDISSKSLAYVIYTSGSTGDPKGVQITHGSAAAAVDSMIQVQGRKSGEWRSLQFSNYVFDASVLDIFNTLNSGGTLCMAPQERLLSELPEVLREMNVNETFLTPTVARLVDPQDVPDLKMLTVGGEPLTSDVQDEWAADRRVVNAYGPTETSIAVTMKDTEQGGNPKNIGKPLETVQAFIVRPDGHDLSPYGAIGELCIAGPQLSEGYIKRQEITAAAFSDCCVDGVHRMYRTGDLARWLPNNELECLGRKDNQVKVNGHRIELGEVEQAILRTGVATDCAVIVYDLNGNPQLAAFVVAEISSEKGVLKPDVHSKGSSKLKQGLGGLAPYMIPKVLLPLGSMPKLPSGKLDRNLMRSWIQAMNKTELSSYSFSGSGSQEVIPPETDNERVMAQAWADMLKIEKRHIGRESDFLSLGGDSITAINLTSSVRKLGYVLTVSDIMRYGKLRNLAKHLRKDVAGYDENAVALEYEASREVFQRLKDVGVTEDDIEYIYPCPPGQVEFLLNGARRERYWVLMTTRKLPKSTDIDRWIETVEKLTLTNDILRTTFTKAQNEWIGIVLRLPKIDVQYFDIATEEQKTQLIENVWNSDFAIGQPFIRYVVFRWPNGIREVVTKMDHGLYDGTLLRIFAGHFQTLQSGTSVPDFTSFRDFAFHLWKSDKSRALDFWTGPMRPSGFQYPKVEDPSITSTISVPTEIKLDQFASLSGVTVPVVFQTAFQIWLAETTKATDVSYDYLYTGRNIDMPNPQLINGNCANFLPLRSQFKRSDTIKEYLADTQSGFWEATENGVVGLEDIYAAAGVTRREYGNRALFLFQPFEPAASPPPQDEMRWVVMALSEVKMPQPYALVIEIMKSLKGYKIKLSYDEKAFNRMEALDVAQRILEIASKMSLNGDSEVGTLL